MKKILFIILFVLMFISCEIKHYENSNLDELDNAFEIRLFCNSKNGTIYEYYKDRYLDYHNDRLYDQIACKISNEIKRYQVFYDEDENNFFLIKEIKPKW